jgi:hypothetical protein
MPALRNPVHESMCRDVAGGMSREAAWRAAGFGSRNSTRFFKRPEIAARVTELQEEFAEGSRISLAYLQERMLSYAQGDVTDYLEPRPYTDGKLRVRNLKELPPELRARIARVTIDKNGTINFEIYDKVKALETLIRSIGPTRLEVTGRDGGPINLSDPANLARLDEEELQMLQHVVLKIESHAAAEPAEAGEAE